MGVLNPLLHFDSSGISEEQRLPFKGMMALRIHFCTGAE